MNYRRFEMLNDPITEEIRSIRRKLAAQFDNDVSRILADVREHEASDGRSYVTLPKRPACTETTDRSDVRRTRASDER